MFCSRITHGGEISQRRWRFVFWFSYSCNYLIFSCWGLPSIRHRLANDVLTLHCGCTDGFFFSNLICGPVSFWQWAVPIFTLSASQYHTRHSFSPKKIAYGQQRYFAPCLDWFSAKTTQANIVSNRILTLLPAQHMKSGHQKQTHGVSHCLAAGCYWTAYVTL